MTVRNWRLYTVDCYDDKKGLDRVWNEVTTEYFKVQFQQTPGGNDETTTASVRLVGVQTAVRNVNRPNTSQKTLPLDPTCSVRSFVFFTPNSAFPSLHAITFVDLVHL